MNCDKVLVQDVSILGCVWSVQMRSAWTEENLFYLLDWLAEQSAQASCLPTASNPLLWHFQEACSRCPLHFLRIYPTVHVLKAALD